VKPDDKEKPVIPEVEKSKQIMMIEEKLEKLEEPFRSRFRIKPNDPINYDKFILDSISRLKKSFKKDCPNELSKFFKEISSFNLIHNLKKNEFFTELIGYVLEEKDSFFGYMLIETFIMGNLRDYFKEKSNPDNWHQMSESGNGEKLNQQKEILIDLSKQIAEGNLKIYIMKNLLDEYFLTFILGVD